MPQVNLMVLPANRSLYFYLNRAFSLCLFLIRLEFVRTVFMIEKLLAIFLLFVF